LSITILAKTLYRNNYLKLGQDFCAI